MTSRTFSVSRNSVANASTRTSQPLRNCHRKMDRNVNTSPGARTAGCAAAMCSGGHGGRTYRRSPGIPESTSTSRQNLLGTQTALARAACAAKKAGARSVSNIVRQTTGGPPAAAGNPGHGWLTTTASAGVDTSRSPTGSGSSDGTSA
jgi:hypothetical protein